MPAPCLAASGAPAGSDSSPGPGAARRDRLLVPVAGLCLLVGTAAYLMVFTMLGQIASALHVPGALLGWIVIATIITGTLSAALFPALGAVVGQRRQLNRQLVEPPKLVERDLLHRRALPRRVRRAGDRGERDDHLAQQRADLKHGRAVRQRPITRPRR